MMEFSGVRNSCDMLARNSDRSVLGYAMKKHGYSPAALDRHRLRCVTRSSGTRRFASRLRVLDARHQGQQGQTDGIGQQARFDEA